MASKRLVILLPLLVASLHGCADKPASLLENAKTALAGNDFAGAQKYASDGLALEPQDARIQWQLELTLLEARSRTGDVEATLTQLQGLVQNNNPQVKAAHFVTAADRMRSSGNKEGSIKILDAGAKSYPQDPAITKAIEQAKSSADETEQNALRSLGYLD